MTIDATTVGVAAVVAVLTAALAFGWVRLNYVPRGKYEKVKDERDKARLKSWGDEDW